MAIGTRQGQADRNDKITELLRPVVCGFFPFGSLSSLLLKIGFVWKNVVSCLISADFGRSGVAAALRRSRAGL
jgi:hypothetical protein